MHGRNLKITTFLYTQKAQNCFCKCLKREVFTHKLSYRNRCNIAMLSCLVVQDRSAAQIAACRSKFADQSVQIGVRILEFANQSSLIRVRRSEFADRSSRIRVCSWEFADQSSRIGVRGLEFMDRSSRIGVRRSQSRSQCRMHCASWKNYFCNLTYEVISNT